MPQPRRIGVLPDPVARPLFARFAAPEFLPVPAAPGAHAAAIRGQSLDAAFLSPIDAARGLPGCRAAGTASLVARAGSGTATLLFHSGVRDVRSLAADPGRTSEIVLAAVILREQYSITPAIVPSAAPARGAAPTADAALVTGGDGFQGAAADGLDLVEQWMEISDLPFVHGLWYARDGAFDGGEGEVFSPPAAGASAGPHPGAGAVSFTFDDEARAGLAEFVRMAYYHGILPEIPEFSSFMPDARA